MSAFSLNRRQLLASMGAIGTAALWSLDAATADAAEDASLAPAYPLHSGANAWETFKAYDPATDPDARFFQSRTPLARRIAAFAATQAHPQLRADTSASTLNAAYLTLDGSDADFSRTRYAAASRNRVHVERAWQYQDLVIGWNGTGCIPNPALTDAAHRNGALCLGTLFQPDAKLFNGTDLSRSEVAAKLVGLAAFFGFDGYFVNFEDYTDKDASQVQDLIELMRQTAAARNLTPFYVQFYNGQTDIRAVWPGPPHADGRAREANALRADSMMLDQGWSHYGLTHGCCSGIPLDSLPGKPITPGIGDPATTVFYGLQLYPGPGYLGLAAPRIISPNGDRADGGLAIYSVEDGLRKMRRARQDQLRRQPHLTPAEQRELASFADPHQAHKAWYSLHRQFWSGQSGNPAKLNRPSAKQLTLYAPINAKKIYTDYEAPGAPTDQLRLPITYGVANFIAERSVIGSLPFVTHFNTGEGERFFSGGVQVADAPWFNLGAQDLLPTWQWWTKPMFGRFDPEAATPELLSVDFDYEHAYDGGSSLCISGTLGPKNPTEVRLYKTKLAIAADTQLSLRFKTASGGASPMKVGLIFEDAPETCDWIAVKRPARRTAGSGWRTWRTSLGNYRGRTLAALSLGFETRGAARPLRIQIGEIALTAGADPAPPATPQGFKIEQSRVFGDGRSAELRLSWTLDPGVKYYDLLKDGHAGQPATWLGRITGDAYYVNALSRAGDEAETTLRLVPYDPARVDLSSGSASVRFVWG